MIIVKQSTARTFMVGPVLDASGVAVTDGVIGDFKISKNGAAPAALNGSATLTHRHTGFYSLAATATDLNTIGQAEITIDDTVNSCPMKEFMVIEAPIYDALFGASANAFTGAAGSSTLTALATGSITAAVIANGAIDAATFAADVDRKFGNFLSGTMQSGSTSTTAVLASATNVADDLLIGRTLAIVAGTGAGQSKIITDWAQSTDTATVTTWTVTPDATSEYVVYLSAEGASLTDIGAAVLTAATANPIACDIQEIDGQAILPGGPPFDV